MTKKELQENFYDCSYFFNDNLILLTLAIHHFYYTDVQLSKLRKYVEFQNLDKISDGLDKLLKLDIVTLRWFEGLFWTIDYPEDFIFLSEEQQESIYNSYKFEYDKIKR